MLIEKTKLAGVLILQPKRFEDHRGFFSESWSKRVLDGAGLHYNFVQDNHSMSREKATVRGLHFQAPPHAQDKLVRCGRGRIFDVAVDARRESKTYGEWVGVELSFANGRQLLVPAGCLHGFMTLEDNCEIVYKCSDYYSPDCDGAVRWDSCDIAWPDVGRVPHLSEKDARAVAFTDFESPFLV